MQLPDSGTVRSISTRHECRLDFWRRRLAKVRSEGWRPCKFAGGTRALQTPPPDFRRAANRGSRLSARLPGAALTAVLWTMRPWLCAGARVSSVKVCGLVEVHARAPAPNQIAGRAVSQATATPLAIHRPALGSTINHSPQAAVVALIIWMVENPAADNRLERLVLPPTPSLLKKSDNLYENFGRMRR
jgi:hypothetical protein